MVFLAIAGVGPDTPLALGNGVMQAVFVVGFMLVVFLAIALQFFKVHELYGGGDAAPEEQQTNCPSCGARTSIETDACEYCGEPIDR